MPTTPDQQSIAAALACLVLLGAVAPTARAQNLQLTPDLPRALVGDEVQFTLRARFRPGQELLDLTPRNILPPPSGIRVLATDSLRASGEGEFTSRIRIVFFRVGPQPVPTFSVLFRPGPGELPDTLVHAPVAMEIGSIIPSGNPALKDIRPLQIIGGPSWGPLALLSALVGAACVYLWKRGRLGSPTPGTPPPLVLELGPFERSLNALAALEQRAHASGNSAIPLYSDVAEVLRECLVSAGALRSSGLTTPETAQALPPVLGLNGGRERLFQLLADADLVKFAQVRPDFPAALEYIDRARGLLTTWKEGVAATDEAEPPSRRTAGATR